MTETMFVVILVLLVVVVSLWGLAGIVTKRENEYYNSFTDESEEDYLTDEEWDEMNKD